MKSESLHSSRNTPLAGPRITAEVPESLLNHTRITLRITRTSTPSGTHFRPTRTLWNPSCGAFLHYSQDSSPPPPLLGARGFPLPSRLGCGGLLHLACCCMSRLPAPPNRGGRFPFPREKGSEKGSQETWEGCTGKPDFSQKSGFKSGCLELRIHT